MSLPYYYVADKGSKRQKTISRVRKDKIIKKQEVKVVVDREIFDLRILCFKDGLPVFYDTDTKSALTCDSFEDGAYILNQPFKEEYYTIYILQDEAIEEMKQDATVYVTLVIHYPEQVYADEFFTWKLPTDLPVELGFIKDAFDVGYTHTQMKHDDFIELAEKYFGPALNPLTKRESGVQVFVHSKVE